MSITVILKVILIFGFVLALGSCPPPTITNFGVVPSTTCAGTSVAINWTADAEEVDLIANPPTGETLPTGLPVVMARFGFRTASENTTYTLRARRAGQVVTSTPVTVNVIHTPFPLNLELTYNCEAQRWEHPGFNSNEYGRVISIESFTNNDNTQALLIDDLDIPPHETRFFAFPGQLPGRQFVAFPSGLRPMCTRRLGTTSPDEWENRPPPVHITANVRCP